MALIVVVGELGAVTLADVLAAGTTLLLDDGVAFDALDG